MSSKKKKNGRSALRLYFDSDGVAAAVVRDGDRLDGLRLRSKGRHLLNCLVRTVLARRIL